VSISCWVCGFTRDGNGVDDGGGLEEGVELRDMVTDEGNEVDDWDWLTIFGALGPDVEAVEEEGVRGVVCEQGSVDGKREGVEGLRSADGVRERARVAK